MFSSVALRIHAAARARARVAAFTSTASVLGASGKQLSVENMNQNIVHAEYAVRGELVLKSMEYDAMLARGEGAHLPFEKTSRAHRKPTGPQAKAHHVPSPGAVAVNFRMRLTTPPSSARTRKTPSRARSIVEGMPNGIGAYSESKGVSMLRQAVANFIENRWLPCGPRQHFPHRWRQPCRTNDADCAYQ